jgi:hypothetical protein
MPMRSSVIVSTARTYWGASNDTQSRVPGGHVVAQLVKHSGIDLSEPEYAVVCGGLGSAGLFGVA